MADYNRVDYSPEIPEFPTVNPFLPCYGKFDLTTYIQGASDYEIMTYLVQLYNTMAKGYNDVQKLSTDTVKGFNELQDYVNDFFNSDNFNASIEKALKMLAENGYLDKITSIFCVDDFGADPTGKNDSTSAFNAAFAAAKGRGVVITSNSGTYKITGRVNILANFYGFNSTIHAVCPVRTDLNANLWMFLVNEQSNIVISNLHIVDETPRNITECDFITGIGFVNSNNFILDSFSYSNNTGYQVHVGFDVYGGCHDFKILNSKVFMHNSISGGSWIRAVRGDTYNGLIYNCTFISEGACDEPLGIWPETDYLHDITVKDSVIECKLYQGSKTPVILLLGGGVGSNTKQKSDNLILDNCTIKSDYIPRTVINCYNNNGTDAVNITINNCVFDINGEDTWSGHQPADTFLLIRTRTTTNIKINDSTLSTNSTRGIINNTSAIVNNCHITGTGRVGECYNCDFVGNFGANKASDCTITCNSGFSLPKTLNKCKIIGADNGTGIKSQCFINNGYDAHYCIFEKCLISGVKQVTSLNYAFCHFIDTVWNSNVSAEEVTTAKNYNIGYSQAHN